MRLALWHRVFRRFFPWVWASIVLLLVSGYSMMFLYFGGFAESWAYHIHLMQGTGILMMLLFLLLFFVPCGVFAMPSKGRHSPAAKQLDQIRRIVAINLMLGLLTVIAGASGRFW